MESNEELLEKARNANWTKKSLDFRHTLITLFTMENDFDYETVSKQFEKRVTSLGGHSIDDLLITENNGLARIYVNGENFKNEIRKSI